MKFFSLLFLILYISNLLFYVIKCGVHDHLIDESNCADKCGACQNALYYMKFYNNVECNLSSCKGIVIF